MVDVLLLFLFISIIFLFGFLSNIFFKKTLISNIFFLLLIGYLLGPAFNLIPLQDIFVLSSFTPFFGALALMILLFEGGMHLNFYKVIKEFGRSLSFTMTVFLITVVLIGGLLFFVFQYPILYGLLIGTIVGGVSSAVTVPLLQKSKCGDNTKTILTLESAINDALCVIIAMAIIQIILAGSIDFKVVAQGLISAFAIATVIGIIGGFIWLKVLRDFTHAKEFSYFLTLSFLMFLYAITEYFQGNGAFCALVFGLVLGNSPEILKMFRMKEFRIEKSILRFQHEISLFIRTFFFVYLGLIVDLSVMNISIIFIVVLILIIILLSRIISTSLLFSKTPLLKKDSGTIVALHARGLAAAVLATYPISVGITNQYSLTILPISFLIIFLTNFTTTVYFFVTEQKKQTLMDLKTEIQKDFKQKKTVKKEDIVKKEEPINYLKK
jgi:potassium/hydrogen antiporter